MAHRFAGCRVAADDWTESDTLRFSAVGVVHQFAFVVTVAWPVDLTCEMAM